MQFEPTAFAGCFLITPKKFGDERGFFSEVFRESEFREAGIAHSWVQDNHSYSATPGTLRGLHLQVEPFAQAKLLRVTRGAILDVVVDVRPASATFRQHFAVELSAVNWKQIYVPVGFAHGFCTLTPDCEVHYKVSAPYSPTHERGVNWNDPELAIAWPEHLGPFTMTDRDRNWPHLTEFLVRN